MLRFGAGAKRSSSVDLRDPTSDQLQMAIWGSEAVPRLDFRPWLYHDSPFSSEYMAIGLTFAHSKYSDNWCCGRTTQK